MKEDEEKLAEGYGGQENFDTSDTNRQILLLKELMRETSSRKPCMHAVISWADGERPTPEQVDEAVQIWRKTLRLKNLPTLWAVHENTKNLHCHVVVCLVDPETSQWHDPTFYKRDSQRAKARIEKRQGWKPCAEDIFIPDPAGPGIIPNPDRGRRKKAGMDLPPLKQGTAAMEQRTGVQSAQSTAQEEVPAILEAADGWQDFHSLLAEAGMAFRPTPRGGFVFTIDGVDVKATSVMRKCGKKLEAKFGPYAPPVADVPAPAPAPAVPAPATGMDEELEPFWLRYLAEKEAWQAESRRQAKQAREEWKARMAAVVEANRVARKQMKAEIRLATRLVKKARRQSGRLHAGTEVALRLALEERGRARLVPVPAQGRSARPAFPAFATWLELQDEPDLASRWRHRGTLLPQPAPAPEEPEESFGPRPGL